jgi:ABC-type antimicrobial peptide transport system permease subunit
MQHADRAELASARFIVSAAVEPSSIVTVLAASIRTEEPRLSPPTIEIATDLVERTLAQERLLARLSTAFAGVALTVTGIGLYGLLAYRAARRTAEFALRLALGASRLQMLGAFLWDEFVLVLAGLGLGLSIAVLASRALGSLLFGVEATNPVVLGVAVALTLLAGAAAAVVPLRGAGRVNAIDALRAE